MLKVLINEVNLDFVHSFVDALEHQVMPVGAQAKKFSEVGHIVLKDGVDNAWFEHTVVATELDVSLSLLDDNCLLFRLDQRGVHGTVKVVAPPNLLTQVLLSRVQ